MEISVSIVIPCHNSERWVALAIASALEQTWPEKETIVVDDDSTDGSVAKIRSFGNRVRFLHGVWHNGNAARNRGLEEAKGAWVQFLDADDLLLPGKIEIQLAGASAGADVIYSPIFLREGPEDSPVETMSFPTEGADFVEQWLRWELCQTGAALWRTDSLKKIGAWKEGLPCCQDNEVILRALQAGLKFQFVDAPGAIYRIWSEETVSRKDPRRVVRQKTALIDDCLAWLDRRGGMNDRYRAAAGQACFEMARMLAVHDIDEATAYFNERKSLGLIAIAGSAAPAKFRLIERFLGFGNAERIAGWLR